MFVFVDGFGPYGKVCHRHAVSCTVVLVVLGGIFCNDIIVPWLTQRDYCVMVDGTTSESERMSGARGRFFALG